MPQELKKLKDTRPDWDTYFIAIAMMAATRSTCLRRQVGAVIVQNRQIISTGYNGAPSRTAHCMEVGCLREILDVPSGERQEMCRGSHAESNAIAQAARMGIATDGGALYCTCEPCSLCTKVILNAGIARVVYMESYPDKLAVELRKETQVVFEPFPQDKAEAAREWMKQSVFRFKK
ncbi:MAG: cytidine/deoxycytidylate deaminase family protein [Synergistaceae bacterium]|jgi:dCMP deaminase|nr:cytidine/deoxycytidylate deaminase family protein [Synergistaceae bacterium]